MIGFKQTIAVTFLATGIGFTGSAQASLYDRGNGLVYDDILNITITKDVSLFQTRATSDTNLVNKIIADIGTVADSYFGPHVLTSNDFHSNFGSVTWWGAQAWIGYLNFHNFDGYNDWRLPKVSPVNGSSFNDNWSYDGSTDNGWNITSKQSELAYLYNVELHNLGYVGNPSKASFQDAANAGSTDSFTTLQSSWTGTEYTPPVNKPQVLDNGSAWYFQVSGGGQSAVLKSNYDLFAWAVRTGDVAPVPIPGANWLFASGLVGLLSFTRRKKQNN
jgi:hypothetical protein